MRYPRARCRCSEFPMLGGPTGTWLWAASAPSSGTTGMDGGPPWHHGDPGPPRPRYAGSGPVPTLERRRIDDVSVAYRSQPRPGSSRTSRPVTRFARREAGSDRTGLAVGPGRAGHCGSCLIRSGETLVRRWRPLALVVAGLLVVGSAASSTSMNRRFEVQRLPRPVARGHGLVPADKSVSLGPTPATGPTPTASPAAQLPRPAASPGSLPQPALPAASVLVKFKEGTADNVRDRALGTRHATAVGAVGDTGYIKVQPSGDPAALVAALKADP